MKVVWLLAMFIAIVTCSGASYVPEISNPNWTNRLWAKWHMSDSI